MRIRRRPSSSLNPDPSLQPPPKEERASGGLHPPDGDLPDPPLQTLHPQHNTLEVLKEEEKIQVLDDSPSQQTLSYMHAQGSGRAGSAAEAPFGVGGLAWCNGESAVAVPRKRRGSRVAGEDDAVKATKPVSTSSNSIAPGNSNNNAAGGGEVVVMGEEGKRKKRGSPVLMEGSRCSRVNGRGWRCCQQTLVGYSLCEHHLGKGRLRSMSSVRGTKLSGASTTTTTIKHKNVIDGASAAAKQEEEEEQCLGANDHSYGGTNKGSKKKEKKKKIGTIKARSISTLLDETDHAAAAIISSLAVPVLEIDKRLV